ncbi:MAG: acyl-ACP desaturase [Candidatus Nomurabacteria bacterium]|nr:MAG: acyl-ACP desaturase [Candidatus Nomurabacteria bacterium]
MTKNVESTNILRELEPVVESELNRHEKMVKNWYPHDYVPWSEGKNFAYLGGEDWEPTQSRLGKAARAAMYVNLLTEDNLPSYHRVISATFGRDSAWGTWVDRWTAEENKHGIAMRDYLTVTRAINPVELEQARMQQMTSGYQSEKSPLDAVAYVTMQELATRIAHRNTGIESRKDGDELAEKLLARIALDENLHMLFYRNIGTAAFEVEPNEMMKSVTEEILGFQMPGAASIPDFWANAAVIADAEIYDLNIHANSIVNPTLKHWKVWDRTDLSGEGAEARDKLGRYMLKLESKAQELVELREEQKAAQNTSQN